MKLNLSIRPISNLLCLLSLASIISIQPLFSQPVHDSIVVAASKKYMNPSPVVSLLFGNNYRKEWSTPVKMPVFDLQTEQGGFTIIEAGGGRQTSNLRLKDKNGKEWVLRSIDKNVEESITPQLRNTFIETFQQDLISASHPYGALTLPVLAKAAGVIVAQARIFFIPDDPAFGEYRKSFANTVCFLEDRKPVANDVEMKNTVTVMNKVNSKSGHYLIQHAILRARLLDMLIADWDRHGDQWRWMEIDSSGSTYYHPVPRDRDYAYFNSTGILVKWASVTSLPYMYGFKKRTSSLKRLNSKLWNIDASWLNALTADDWKSAIIFFQENITDSVIESAIKNLPPEIYAINGKKISDKLKMRRDRLMKDATRYYEFLAAHAFVIGTDSHETFIISSDGKNLVVKMSTRQKDNSKPVVYQRHFLPRDTKRISVLGLDGDDDFIIDETVSSPIRIYLKGGTGNDTYNRTGKIKTIIKDPDDINGQGKQAAIQVRLPSR